MFNRITIYTTAHLILGVVFWILIAGATGLGFKGEWSSFDYIFYSFSLVGVHIFALPTWLLLSIELPEWGNYLIIPLQILYSFISVNVILFLIELYQSHNKARQNGPSGRTR
jgi:hypothetical protein